jgi:hypothetical protein
MMMSQRQQSVVVEAAVFLLVRPPQLTRYVDLPDVDVLATGSVKESMLIPLVTQYHSTRAWDSGCVQQELQVGQLPTVWS